ncbi:hypothetical protein MVES1_002545 [Malassezia vespertilionis]|uniref:Ammonium transporter n=1 Tax=Malassezia vespertilionis TaxID=2020962 RepID=A0A2N1JA81_9BASI|nr:uncharacterized protein MVES1_002545 [Malassezia vespertilionis]PKI83460.1 hypothetical protein MVES_002404 [Malassezia vespertilionis]WFD07186.1 hypothetical protein MVES1_002545 [Malassezia vespertilionis]
MVEVKLDNANNIVTNGMYNLGDISWILVSTCLVFLIGPGIGFFYAGLLRRKNALSMIGLCFALMAVVSIQWFFWGFSLAFSDSGNPFIGDMKNFGLINVDMQPSAGAKTIPQLVYCIYQMMFASIAPVIMCGAFSERCRIGPILIFAFCWTTIVYDPIAFWTWNVGKGWANKLGALDFAGGTPLHISSGSAALAISLYIGRRRGYGTEQLAYRPNNVTYVALGTILLWFGWFGFNGGSGLGANLRSAQAIMVTHISACSGGFTWMLLDYRLERKWSVVGFCSGVISGLVSITPAAGYVGTPSALVFGILGAAACNFATQLKNLLGYDDALDIFAAHAVGGMVGNFLTALFADGRVSSFDGSDPSLGSGWINHHWIQLGYQLAAAFSGMGWSFVLTFILLFIVDHVPYCHFRMSEEDEEDEMVGADIAQIGEEAYAFLGTLDLHLMGNSHLHKDAENATFADNWLAREKPANTSNEALHTATVPDNVA